MTSITRNFPWFIRDLGVSIVGEKCYVSLVENLNVSDVDCLKYAVSKGLGIGIVVGGSIMKVPQLLLIISAKSARGLSLSAYVLETLAYAITLAYSYRNNFPFSTYGENLFLTIQNVIITLLIIYYPTSRLTRTPNTAPQLALAAALTAVSGVALYAVPLSALAALQMATIPLSLFSKIPQIRQNARARSTGQLSAFAVISQIVGCLARLFTTAAEVGDILLASGYALALALNVVLGFQMWTYWGKDGVKDRGIPLEQDGKVDIIVQPASPTVSTQGRAPSGRKWARKVD
ncbi:hypothetical protein BC629DRAFT_1282886 [Irpex lacteus]|nr:hypothetical protein BC629DRAFT_1282886 [Irpex lacteus]